MSATNRMSSSYAQFHATINDLLQTQPQVKTGAQQLKIFDSMSAQKQVFKPIEAGKVGMYVCGMTIYDYSHIGHAKVGIVYDMVARWLRVIGYEVTYVRNITDIDDKIINRANETGQDIHELTEHFINIMQQDLTALGCEAPTVEPRATDYIDDMLDMIGTLEEKDHAYAASNGDVYYAVDTFAEYGKLSKRKLEDLQAGARVDVDTDKRNPFDFVLWKAAKPNEPQWQSDWGNGRPGWHIECSAMSTKILGNSFDIHGGGHDLQFPHHENEIAQSEAATGCTYANYWMHVGFINVDGEKMSKSLGNFFTIKEIREKFHPEVIRFFILSSHYRSQVNFSDSVLQDANTSLTRIYQALKAADAALAVLEAVDEAASNGTTNIDDLKNQYILDFASAMNDDFNTPLAISVLFSLVKEINKLARETDNLSDTSEQAARPNYLLLKELTDLLRGLSAIINIGQLNPTEFLQTQIGTVDDNQLSDEKIAALIQERLDARSNKDFARADDIRDLLQDNKIELEDGKQTTTWRRL